MPHQKTAEQLKKKGKWTEQDLNSALEAIRGGTSIRKAEKMFNVPFSTLRQRIATGVKNGPKMGRSTIFTPEQEKQMAQEIILLAKLFYGLTAWEIRMAAYEFVVKNDIPHPFNTDSKVAGKAWFTGFRRRNPELTIRKPENTSLNRIKAFNRAEVSLFFDNWEKLLNDYAFCPSKIFNMDETGISAVSDSLPIVAEKGQKRVGKVASGERGKNVTVICAANAAGEYVPPMFVFPRQRVTDALKNDGPAGAIYHGSTNGYSNSSLFFTWLEHFVANRKCSKNDPVVIILDNHESHISIESYDFCRENGIVMLSLPPHTSHRMQPLDVSFFGPLKAAYKRESDAILKESKGRKITCYEMASVFRKAYASVASMKNAISGFTASGIYPFNRNIFADDEYMPAEVLEIIDTQRNEGQNNPSHVLASDLSSLILPDNSSVLQALFNNTGTPLNSPISHDVVDGEPVEQESSQLSQHSEDEKGLKDSSGLLNNLQIPYQTAKESEVGGKDSSSKDSRQSGSTPFAPEEISTLTKSPRRRRFIQQPRSRSSSIFRAPSSTQTSNIEQLTPTSSVPPSLSSPSSFMTPAPTQSSVPLQTSTLITPTTHQLLSTPSSISLQIPVPGQSTPITHLVRPLIPSHSPSLKLSTSQIVILNVSATPSQIVEMTKRTSPANISPVQRGRKKQHSTIITASPMRKVLETKQRNRIEREAKSCQREKRVRVKKEKENSPESKKKRVEKLSLPKKTKGSRKVVNKSKQCEKNKKILDVNENEELACAVCQEYGKDELWFRCRTCGKWSHAACVTTTNADEFICDNCSE